MLLNNELVNQEIKEIKKAHGNKSNWKQNGVKPLGCSKSGPKRKVYNNPGVPQEARKTLNNLTLHLAEARKKNNK